MKTYYKLFILFLTVFCGMSCSDDDDNDRADLTLDIEAVSSFFRNDTVILDATQMQAEALTIQWDKATDLGTGYSIDYIFRLDIAYNDYATSTDPEIINDGFSKSFTTEELNDLLLERWLVFPGDVVELQARVVAKVEGPKFLYPEIGTCFIKVQSFPLPSQPLYLIGTATEAGSNPAEAIRMNEVSNSLYYTWKGNLKPGDFKFITSRESMLPSLNKGKDSQTLVERKTESDPDTWFTIEAGDHEGIYAINLYRKEMTIDFQHVPFENAYLVGNGCDAGWETGKALELQWNQRTPNIFTLQTSLKAGEIKILTARDFNSHTFKPLIANGSIQETTCQGEKGGPDLKWVVKEDEAGDYLITLNTIEPSIQFTKME